MGELQEVSEICRECGTLVGGVEAGEAIKWVVCSQCADPKSHPDFVFFMDGIPHYRRGTDEHCCDPFQEPCECGGLRHYQPTCGGYYYKCERCGKET